VLGCASFFALWIQIPQVIHVLDHRYQGILVALNSDEGVYLARVEEALAGRPEQASEAFVGDSALRGSQPALLESWYGSLFSWTGLRAAEVLQIMDSVNVFFLVLLLWILFRLCGFSQQSSLVGTILFCAIEAYNLNRPVHLAGSTVLTIAAVDGILLGLRFQRFLGMAGGMLMGTLVGVYVWSFMWAWAFWGVLLLLAWIDAFRSPQRQRTFSGLFGLDNHTIRRLLLFALIGLLFALPHLYHLWSLAGHPLYAEAVFRSGMHPGRAPESWPYSAIFTSMAGAVLIAFVQDGTTMHKHRSACAMILTGWIVMHQQLVHGIVFNYVSHSLLLLVIAAMCSVLLAWRVRTKTVFFGACSAAVYLAAVAYDGRFVWKQWHPTEARFAQQHLASALPVLDAMPRATVLSSDHGSAFIAGFTRHDIVYSIYLKNVLMSHEEIARRFCITLLPLPSELRGIPDRKYLIYPDANAAFGADPSVRAKEVGMVEAACAAQDRDPLEALRAFHVQYVFWDMRNDPDWQLSRFGVRLEKISEGDGWSLWKVPR